MYQLGRNLKRCQLEAREVQDACVKSTKKKNRQVSKGAETLDNMQTLFSNPKYSHELSDNTQLMQIQLNLLVTAYNLYCGTSRVFAEPVSVLCSDGKFATGVCVYVLEHIMKSMKYDDLLEDLGPLSATCFLCESERNRVLEIQSKAIDRVLEAIRAKTT